MLLDKFNIRLYGPSMKLFNATEYQCYRCHIFGW